MYCPGLDVERLDQPDTLSGDPSMKGFKLRMGDIWQATGCGGHLAAWHSEPHDLRRRPRALTGSPSLGRGEAGGLRVRWRNRETSALGPTAHLTATTSILPDNARRGMNC